MQFAGPDCSINLLNGMNNNTELICMRLGWNGKQMCEVDEYTPTSGNNWYAVVPGFQNATETDAAVCLFPRSYKGSHLCQKFGHDKAQKCGSNQTYIINGTPNTKEDDWWHQSPGHCVDTWQDGQSQRLWTADDDQTPTGANTYQR